MSTTVIPPSRYSRLYDWLKDSQPTETRLGWVHTVSPTKLRQALEVGHITPEYCDFLKESLTYCFYGRPAYRFALKSTIRNVVWAPSVFIFTPKIEELATRMYPFDSGAFLDGRYVEWIPAEYELKEFSLPCNSLSQAQHVEEFYKTNRNYWLGQSTEPTRNFAGELEVTALIELQGDKSGAAADDRKLAVEMCVGELIPLNDYYVRAIVVPDGLMDAPYVRQYRDKGGISVVPYTLFKRKSTADQQSIIEQLVMQMEEAAGAI